MKVLRKNDQIIAVNLILETSVISVISVCAPQIRSTEDEKNVFWWDMDKVIQEIEKNEKIVIEGD